MDAATSDSSVVRTAPRNLASSGNALREYVEREHFSGYDPYDCLSGWIPFHWAGRWTEAVVTQLHKRNPVNLRRAMGIPKGRNPKGVGLFLSAYCRIRRREADERAGEIAAELFEWLLANRSEGYGGSCWGYNFDWANPGKRIRAGMPSSVVTAFVGKGLWDYFHLTKDERAREALLSCCEYVLKALPRTEAPEGLCFSYTHLQRDCCFNANMLAAEILAMGYRLSGNERWAELARRAVDFTVAHQKEDGRWNYSRDPETGRERPQIDFHQGFILDALDAVRGAGLDDPRYEVALVKGARFYRREQFFPDGRGKWRLPKEWPAEIHNQAQGILTFTKLRRLDPEFLAFARRIATWTIANMQDRRGYFYYQKFPRFTNRIPYMRWAQAWMFLALAELREAEGKEK